MAVQGRGRVGGGQGGLIRTNGRACQRVHAEPANERADPFIVPFKRAWGTPKQALREEELGVHGEPIVGSGNDCDLDELRNRAAPPGPSAIQQSRMGDYPDTVVTYATSTVVFRRADVPPAWDRRMHVVKHERSGSS